MSGHARNSPSDAKRWISCPGALNRCAALGIIDKGSNAAADEGTAAHWVREQCLEFGMDAYDMLGAVIPVNGVNYTCDIEMADALQPGLDRIREFDGRLFIEKRVNITKWVGQNNGEDQFGTLDCGVCGEDEIVISDLKYGKGIAVEAVKNYQQVLYGLAFWDQIARHHTQATKFRIIIDQPRNGEGGGEWSVTLEEMQAIGEYVRERAALTFQSDAPCVPTSDGCTWCPAKDIPGNCPEYDAWTGEQFGYIDGDLDDFLDLDEALPIHDPAGLTPMRIRAIYDNRSILSNFIKRIESYVKDAVLSGRGDEFGLKFVAGKASRRNHADEEKSLEWLLKNGRTEDEIVTKKLITPAQLDKLLGKGKFPRDLVVGGDKQPVLAPIEDARPALPVISLDEEIDGMDDLD